MGDGDEEGRYRPGAPDLYDRTLERSKSHTGNVAAKVGAIAAVRSVTPLHLSTQTGRLMSHALYHHRRLSPARTANPSRPVGDR